MLKIRYCKNIYIKKTIDMLITIIHVLRPLCPKSPSARGLVACLPVRPLFKFTKHNGFYPGLVIAAMRLIN